MYCEHCGTKLIYKGGNKPYLDRFDYESGKPVYKSNPNEDYWYCPYWECRNDDTIPSTCFMIAGWIVLIGWMPAVLSLNIFLAIFPSLLFIISLSVGIIFTIRHKHRSWLKEFNYK